MYGTGHEHELRQAARATVSLLTPLCRLLTRLHKRGILHNDLSPGNLMFSSNDTAVCEQIEACASLGEMYDLFDKVELGSVYAVLIDYGEASLQGCSRLHPKGCPVASTLASHSTCARLFVRQLRQARLLHDTSHEQALLKVLQQLCRPTSPHSQLLCFTQGYSAPEAATLGMRSALSDSFSLGAIMRSMMFGVWGHDCGDFVKMGRPDVEVAQLKQCQSLQLPMWARLLHVDGAASAIEEEVPALPPSWLWYDCIPGDTLALLQRRAPDLLRVLDALLDPRPLCRGTVAETMDQFACALWHEDSVVDTVETLDSVSGHTVDLDELFALPAEESNDDLQDGNTVDLDDLFSLPNVGTIDDPQVGVEVDLNDLFAPVADNNDDVLVAPEWADEDNPRCREASCSAITEPGGTVVAYKFEVSESATQWSVAASILDNRRNTAGGKVVAELEAISGYPWANDDLPVDPLSPRPAIQNNDNGGHSGNGPERNDDSVQLNPQWRQSMPMQYDVAPPYLQYAELIWPALERIDGCSVNRHSPAPVDA
ncbi:MAG: hypothetical protein MHM6MM_000116 [Cercozoa sp. M6MM]